MRKLTLLIYEESILNQEKDEYKIMRFSRPNNDPLV